MSASPKDQKILTECAATDEPFIVFRAKDILSLMVLKHYQGLIELYTPHDAEFQEALQARTEEFRAWQKQHPSEVKLPD